MRGYSGATGGLRGFITASNLRKFYKVYTKVVPGIKPYDPKAPAADGWL